jgi:hypothetical protein
MTHGSECLNIQIQKSDGILKTVRSLVRDKSTCTFLPKKKYYYTLHEIVHIFYIFSNKSNLYLARFLTAVVTLTYTDSSSSIYQILFHFSVAYNAPQDQSISEASVFVSQRGYVFKVRSC